MSLQQGISPIPGADVEGGRLKPPARQSMWAEIFRYRDNRLAFLLIVPSLLTLVLVQFYPIVYTGWLILTDEKGVFIGLANLTRLTRDTIFRGAFFFSLKMGIVVVPLSLLLGLGLALLVRSDYAGRKAFWISILIIPLMVSEIVAGTMWKIMYHPTLGLVNIPLTALGLDPIIWLMKANTAFIALCIVEIWRVSPLAFLLLYAGLSQVPRDIYEAAAVDGATRWRAVLGYDHPLYQADVLNRHHSRVRLVHAHDRHDCGDDRGRAGQGDLEPVVVYLRHVLPEIEAPLCVGGRAGHAADDLCRGHALRQIPVGGTQKPVGGDGPHHTGERDFRKIFATLFQAL